MERQRKRANVFCPCKVFIALVEIAVRPWQTTVTNGNVKVTGVKCNWLYVLLERLIGTIKMNRTKLCFVASSMNLFIAYCLPGTNLPPFLPDELASFGGAG